VSEVIYPPCKKCGAAHKMGVEEMATGKITPMDICYNCLWFAEMKPITEKIHLTIEDVALKFHE